MVDKSLASTLDSCYAEHDNARLLLILQNTAKLVTRLWQSNLFYPGLTTDKLTVMANDNIILTDETKLTERACDITSQVEQLSQLNFLPDYMRVFLHMLWQEQDIPAEFEKAFHKIWPQALLDHDPSILTVWQNTWLWDENSAQAMVVLKRKQKKQLRKRQSNFGTVRRLLTTAPKLFRVYKKTLCDAYQHKVCLKDKIGIALHPEPSYQSHEEKLLDELGGIPVLIRFMSHQPESTWKETIEYVKRLTTKKIKVSIALLQDRNAVLNSEHWQFFLQTVIPQLQQWVEWIEVGHAVNRVKWGVWTPSEYAKLFAISHKFKQQYSNLRLVGPAIIDFEWFRIIDFVKALPKKVKLFGLSQHLYVDRRGAPENFQGKFSTLEKCAMGKALAKTLAKTDDRFIISEFNWPLQGTGVHSPIGSPYTTPEWFAENPGVTEEEYANYLIRYLTIATASGFVEQAFCWRLSAHGYGLVDDLDGFRRRPAFYALKFFIALLGEATFLAKEPSDKDAYVFSFKTSQAHIILAWSNSEKPIYYELQHEPICAYKLCGDVLENSENGAKILLGDSPCYYQLQDEL